MEAIRGVLAAHAGVLAFDARHPQFKPDNITIARPLIPRRKPRAASRLGRVLSKAGPSRYVWTARTPRSCPGGDNSESGARTWHHLDRALDRELEKNGGSGRGHDAAGVLEWLHERQFHDGLFSKYVTDEEGRLNRLS